MRTTLMRAAHTYSVQVYGSVTRSVDGESSSSYEAQNAKQQQKKDKKQDQKGGRRWSAPPCSAVLLVVHLVVLHVYTSRTSSHCSSRDVPVPHLASCPRVTGRTFEPHSRAQLPLRNFTLHSATMQRMPTAAVPAGCMTQTSPLRRTPLSPGPWTGTKPCSLEKLGTHVWAARRFVLFPPRSIQV